jgi:hypothetical protein
VEVLEIICAYSHSINTTQNVDSEYSPENIADSALDPAAGTINILRKMREECTH